MELLSELEIDAVDGGVLPLIGVALTILLNSDKLSDFFSGVFDGYGGI